MRARGRRQVEGTGEKKSVCARVCVTVCLCVCKAREKGGRRKRGENRVIGPFQKVVGWQQGSIAIQVPHAFCGMSISTIGTLFALQGCSEHPTCSLCTLKKG